MGVLSQPNNKEILLLVAYFSRKHLPAEINYEVYDKELFIIIPASKE
jgi:hypothetical protein